MSENTDNNQQSKSNPGGVSRSSNRGNNFRGTRNDDTEYKTTNRDGYDRGGRNYRTDCRGARNNGISRAGHDRSWRNDRPEYPGSNQYSKRDNRSNNGERGYQDKRPRARGRTFQNSSYRNNLHRNEPYEPGKNINAPAFDPTQIWGETTNSTTDFKETVENKSSNVYLEAQSGNIEEKASNLPHQIIEKINTKFGESLENESPNEFLGAQFENIQENTSNLPNQLTEKCIMESVRVPETLDCNLYHDNPKYIKNAPSPNLRKLRGNTNSRAPELSINSNFENENKRDISNSFDDNKPKININSNAEKKQGYWKDDGNGMNNVRTHNKKHEGWDKNVNPNFKITNPNDSDYHKSVTFGGQWDVNDDVENKTANSNQSHSVPDDWDVEVEDKNINANQFSSDISNNSWDVEENEDQSHLEKNSSIDKNDSQGESILNTSSEIDNEEEPVKQPGILEGQWKNNEKNYKQKSEMSMQSTNRLSHYNQSTKNNDYMKPQRKTIGKISTDKKEQSTSEDKDFVEFENKFRFKKIPFKTVKEMDGDLFEMPEQYALANCVAEDMNMGSGIAVTFRQKFKGHNELLSQKSKQGGLAFLKTEEGRYIYYLVTKRESNLKPTLETLFKSMKKLKDHMVQNEVKKLAIPRLGCGLDRLEWTDVKNMLEYVFGETDVEIMVCNYQKAAETMQEQNKNHHMRRCKIENSSSPIVEIAAYTIIIYFGTEDGYVSPQMEALDKRFDIIKHYRNGTRKLGQFLFIDKFNYKYPHYGCIVRKTAKDSFDFNALSSCITEINKINKKYKDDAYTFVAFQEFEDPEDDLIMKKVVNIMRNTFWGITLYVCPK